MLLGAFACAAGRLHKELHQLHVLDAGILNCNTIEHLIVCGCVCVATCDTQSLLQVVAQVTTARP